MHAAGIETAQRAQQRRQNRHDQTDAHRIQQHRQQNNQHGFFKIVTLTVIEYGVFHSYPISDREMSEKILRRV